MLKKEDRVCVVYRSISNGVNVLTSVKPSNTTHWVTVGPNLNTKQNREQNKGFIDIKQQNNYIVDQLQQFRSKRK